VELPNAPVLDTSSKWTTTGIALRGSVAAAPGKPNQVFTVELFASRLPDHHPADESGWGEGEKYLGTASAVTDATGIAIFTVMLKPTDPFGDGGANGFFTATVTDAAGSTSKFSKALSLNRQ
jgi:hypothetical protein